MPPKPKFDFFSVIMPRKGSPQPSSSSAPGTSSSNDFDIVDGYTQIDEPSPLDRILGEGRSYNGGNWTSEELKSLFYGVHKYGTGKGSINYIFKNVVKTRSEEEIKAKIDEIREMVKEHKEVILPEFYHRKWAETGHRSIVSAIETDTDVNEDWSSVMCKILDHHQQSINKTRNPMRETLESVFRELSAKATIEKDLKVTDIETSRATEIDIQDIRWPVIYQFMQACTSIQEDLPALNELESSIVVKVLDMIEDEASTISDKDKAILAGIFSECQMGDYRFCEQDFPPDVRSGMQLFLDPLRTRSHGIPEVAAEIEVVNDKPTTPSSRSS
ncbi:unnamed protein product [Caenorhabditis sp. 36 PRJEB53466]|nr:unnamed protein product [Caenorhabditis sp. 36 PRJEB53466]